MGFMIGYLAIFSQGEVGYGWMESRTVFWQGSIVPQTVVPYPIDQWPAFITSFIITHWSLQTNLATPWSNLVQTKQSSHARSNFSCLELPWLDIMEMQYIFLLVWLLRSCMPELFFINTNDDGNWYNSLTWVDCYCSMVTPICRCPTLNWEHIVWILTRNITLKFEISRISSLGLELCVWMSWYILQLALSYA